MTDMRFLAERLFFWLRYRDEEARSIASIRHSMRCLGFPIEATDEELIAVAVQAQKAMRELGVTMDEAGRAFHAFGSAFSKTRM